MNTKQIINSVKPLLLLLFVTIAQSCTNNLLIDSDIMNTEIKETKKIELKQKASQNTYTWQKYLQDTKSVSSVLLPGTHDAGAYVVGGSLIFTQKINIQKQLETGIRAMDIRLRAISENKMEIYHGISAQGLYFQADILNTCIQFLKENPQEFIIFSLRKELEDINPKSGYKKVLSKILNKPIYKKYLVQDFYDTLKVKNVRGKILLLHRNYAENVAGGFFQSWRDNTTFKSKISSDKQQNSANVYIEDEYKVPTIFDIQKKWNATKHNLEKSANNKNSKDWFITFASGTSALAYPITVAKTINPELKKFMNSYNLSCKGIIFMDFVTQNDETVQTIIRNNFVGK